VPSMVVLDGPITTVSLDLSLRAGGSPVAAPGTISASGPLEDLRAALSAKLRTVLGSSAVRAETPQFSNLQTGAATVSVGVTTQGVATLPATGYAHALTLPEELEKPVCDYVRALIPGAQPSVEVTDSSVRPGAAASSAEIEEDEASDDVALTDKQTAIVRVLALMALVGSGLFVLAVLVIPVPNLAQFVCGLLLLAGVLFLVAKIIEHVGDT
jgi:hypothetical protein